MPALEHVTLHNLDAYRKARLHALQDSPSAFGSTYARESAFSEQQWINRVQGWNSGRAIGYLAQEGTSYCGIIGGTLDELHASHAEVVSMWVHPSYRRSGVGAALMDAVCTWALSRDAKVLRLMVTSGNHAAIAFYEKLGFRKTGVTGPYPNDPALIEYQMARILLPA